jgi:hypothetical protein
VRGKAHNRHPTTGAGATHFARRLLVRLHD